MKVGLGTDVSGGHAPSMLDAMRHAMDSSKFTTIQHRDATPLSYKEALFLATLGGCEAISVDKELGNFETGKFFDALIIDPNSEGTLSLTIV